MIKIINIAKSFNKQKILNNLNFSIEDGEFLSILGPSGCGKTTLLRILMGLEIPDSGQILKDGLDITYSPPAKRFMGIIFQNYALFENLNVLENVNYALIHNKEFKKLYSKKDANTIALKCIHTVGLSDYINSKPNKLSGGQQQRVAIARTLALNPQIILFDEPMSALDVETRLVLRKEIKEIQKKYKTTMIYITHDQEEAFAMSDRIMVMNKGMIHQIDTPENIIKEPADDYVKSFVINNLQEKINSISKYVKAN